jgi:hypothetical protein
MKRFLAQNNMPFHRYLRIDLVIILFIVLAHKPFDNKVEIILYLTGPGDKFFFTETPDAGNGQNTLYILIVSEVNELAQVVQKEP